ncbi:MAG TPA: hypothetical protein VGW38_20730 [Chloroflexota bacterium]|nr:hypothetical protein [Chloroflexota bacterium]
MPSAEALLQALRRGDGFISASPNGPQVFLTRTTAGAQVRVVGAAGMAILLQGAGGCLAAYPVTADDWSASVALPVGQRYVRAQIVDHAGTIQALTNPLWL